MNAAIVYCSTSGYGQDGPQSTWAGHDLNYLADGGFLQKRKIGRSIYYINDPLCRILAGFEIAGGEGSS